MHMVRMSNPDNMSVQPSTEQVSVVLARYSEFKETFPRNIPIIYKNKCVLINIYLLYNGENQKISIIIIVTIN